MPCQWGPGASIIAPPGAGLAGGHQHGHPLPGQRAARLGEGGPDGVVLTSSVSETPRMSGESIRHVALRDIQVPVLIVHGRHDACRFSPYAWAAEATKALVPAPAKEPLTYDGGSPPISESCEARSAHGYPGLEPQVVADIAAWIRAH